MSLKKILPAAILLFFFAGSAAAMGACLDSGLRVIAKDKMGDGVVSMPGLGLKLCARDGTVIELRRGDSLRQKIIPRLLQFIVDKDAFDPDLKNDPARNPTTTRPAIAWLEAYFSHAKPPASLPAPLKVPLTESDRGNPYYSGSGRGILDIMNEPLSKSCTINARVFAYLLTLAGVDFKDVRMIHAVSVDDAKLMCPQKGRRWWSGFSSPEEAIQKKRIGGEGHDLVEVRSNGTWDLVNTRDLSSDFDLTPGFYGPEELGKLMANTPVVLPESATHKQDLVIKKVTGKFHYKATGGLMVFRVSGPGESTSPATDQYFLHNYAQRLNMIASGDPSDARCRFSANEIQRAANAQLGGLIFGRQAPLQSPNSDQNQPHAAAATP